MDNALDIETATLDIFIFLILIIPAAWFLWAQGCKRCHDRGKSHVLSAILEHVAPALGWR